MIFRLRIIYEDFSGKRSFPIADVDLFQGVPTIVKDFPDELYPNKTRSRMAANALLSRLTTEAPRTLDDIKDFIGKEANEVTIDFRSRFEVKEHRYEVENKYGYATFCKCADCGLVREYAWDPGWPGSYTYFPKDGEKTEKEPPCVQLPEKLEAAVENITPLAPPIK